MSSSAAVADHLSPPTNYFGNEETQSVRSCLDRPRSSVPQTSPQLADLGGSTVAQHDEESHGRVHPDESDDSEAETIVLPESERGEMKDLRRAIKHERVDSNAAMRDSPSTHYVRNVTKDRASRHSPHVWPLAAAHDPKRARRGDIDYHAPSPSHGNVDVCRKVSSTSHSDRGSRYPSASTARNQSHSPPLGHDASARSSSGADTRKRKPQSNQEVRRQRRKTDSIGPFRSHASPATARGRSHRRSESAQSLHRGVPERRLRRSRDSNSDDSEGAHNSSSTAPPVAQPKRGTNMPTTRKDWSGATRLLRACEKGNIEAVKAAYEAEPSERDMADHAGVTPLQRAALHGHADIVEFLLDVGCTTDVHDMIDLDTPLIDATQNGHVSVVKLLLNKGRVDPTYENRNLNTALALLDQTLEEADEIRDVLESAAAKWKRERSEDEPESRAPRSVEDSIGRTLLPNEYNVQVLCRKCEQGDRRAVDELLAFPVTPNVACAIAAARGGHDDILSFLLAAGHSADHRHPEKHTETPMIVAIKHGHLNVIRLLLAQDDFDPTRKTRDDETYAQFARRLRGPHWEKVQRVLAEKYDERMRTTPRRPKSPGAKRTGRRKLQAGDLRTNGSRRPCERETRRRTLEKNANKHNQLVNHAGPKKRLVSRRELNRQARDSSSEEERIRGLRAVASSSCQSSPEPDGPSSEAPLGHPSDPIKSEHRIGPEPSPMSAEECSPKGAGQEVHLEAERGPAQASEAALKEEETKAAGRRADEDRLQRQAEKRRRLERLPRALKRACEKMANRPLHFNRATGEGGVEYNFLPVHVAKRSDIDPDCAESGQDELWMMSFQVVGILGLADLDTRQVFPSWEHKQVLLKHRRGFLETYDVSQLAEDFLFERQNCPGYDAERQSALIQEERRKFLALDPLFWVRYDDFVEATKLDKYRHLDGLELRTAKATVCRTSTPHPTPLSWSEVLFGIKRGSDFEERSKSRSASVSGFLI